MAVKRPTPPNRSNMCPARPATVSTTATHSHVAVATMRPSATPSRNASCLFIISIVQDSVLETGRILVARGRGPQWPVCTQP